MLSTTNYGFLKPEETDIASPIPFNENSDTLDTLIKSLSYEVENALDIARAAKEDAVNESNTYTNTKLAELLADLGDIAAALDHINGEVI